MRGNMKRALELVKRGRTNVKREDVPNKNRDELQRE